MKTSLITLSLLSLLFLGCSPNTQVQQELETVKAQLSEQTIALEAANEEIKALKAGNTGSIVHSVYFKLKPNLSEAEMDDLIKQIKSLKAIEVIKNLEVGTFVDVGDKRAMSDYGIVMHLEFASEKDMAEYQNHEIHLQLKAATGKYLGGPPVVYDAKAL